MQNADKFQPSPWDSAIFNIPCYELFKPDEQSLNQASKNPGHYTVKVEALADKALLHHYGFYYTDTLIEPYATQDQFTPHKHPEATVDSHPSLDKLLPMCDKSFVYGRFHRDFNLPADQADQRYKQWLSQLHAEGAVLGLRYQSDMMGFIAFNGGDLLLHSIAARFRGQGIAKHVWTAAIEYLFSIGEKEIHSSVSAANLAVLNLYASLGFRFNKAQDIYHRLTK